MRVGTSEDSLKLDAPGELTAGSKAVYPGQGPCRIGSVVKRVVDARETMFYHLTVLDDNRCDLFVPVEKAHAIGVRLLVKKCAVPGLLAHLKKSTKLADNWKQRAAANLKLFNSGSPYDLAEVVASLTELRDTKSLTLAESGTLDRARRLLIWEIAEVMGETRAEAEEQVDYALRAPKEDENQLMSTAVVNQSSKPYNSGDFDANPALGQPLSPPAPSAGPAPHRFLLGSPVGEAIKMIWKKLN
jgi:RNA polymerase-interacting CarD/CdnL/TRCF family regulator